MRFHSSSRTEGSFPRNPHARSRGCIGGSASEAGAGKLIVLVNLSGRGDKDVATAAKWFNLVDADSIDSTPEVSP